MDPTLASNIKATSKRITSPLGRERHKSAGLQDLMLSGSDAPLTKILPGKLGKAVEAICLLARKYGHDHPAITREIGE